MVLRTTTKFTMRDGQPRRFFGCSRFPACKAAHGAHPDGTPLGRPADQDTKAARQRVHRICEEIWGDWDTGNRKAMYAWLRYNAPQEHIAEMTEAECDEPERLLRDYQRAL
jgi:hypothetical protein